MENSRETREHREQMGQLLALLGELPPLISDLLYASILLEAQYPELAAELDDMAASEARLFRLWGMMMLRSRMDAPLRRLLCRRNPRLCALTSDGKQAPDAFLSDLQRQMEIFYRQARGVLTIPELEGEDLTGEILGEQERQMRRLERLRS